MSLHCFSSLPPYAAALWWCLSLIEARQVLVHDFAWCPEALAAKASATAGTPIPFHSQGVSTSSPRGDTVERHAGLLLLLLLLWLLLALLHLGGLVVDVLVSARQCRVYMTVTVPS